MYSLQSLLWETPKHDFICNICMFGRIKINTFRVSVFIPPPNSSKMTKNIFESTDVYFNCHRLSIQYASNIRQILQADWHKAMIYWRTDAKILGAINQSAVTPPKIMQ